MQGNDMIVVGAYVWRTVAEWAALSPALQLAIAIVGLALMRGIVVTVLQFVRNRTVTNAARLLAGGVFAVALPAYLAGCTVYLVAVAVSGAVLLGTDVAAAVRSGNRDGAAGTPTVPPGAAPP